jgi:hypothetical protein
LPKLDGKVLKKKVLKQDRNKENAAMRQKTKKLIGEWKK